jgi:hypothetical protein
VAAKELDSDPNSTNSMRAAGAVAGMTYVSNRALADVIRAQAAIKNVASTFSVPSLPRVFFRNERHLAFQTKNQGLL